MMICYQGSLKSLNNCKPIKYMFQTTRGVFFLRAPKRRRQLGHRRTLLGDHETGKKGTLLATSDKFWPCTTNSFDIFKNVN